MVNDLVRKNEDSIALPPEISREAFRGMLTMLRGRFKKWWAGGEAPTESEVFGYAITAVQLGLNPMLDHLRPLGDNLYVTAKGILHRANASPEYDGCDVRPCTAEERLAYYSPSPPPDDEHLWVCDVYCKGRSRAVRNWGRAKVAKIPLGVRASRDNRFSPDQQWAIEMAMKRAKARAHADAFSFGSVSYEEVAGGPDARDLDVEVRVVETIPVVAPAARPAPSSRPAASDASVGHPGVVEAIPEGSVIPSRAGSAGVAQVQRVECTLAALGAKVRKDNGITGLRVAGSSPAGWPLFQLDDGKTVAWKPTMEVTILHMGEPDDDVDAGAAAEVAEEPGVQEPGAADAAPVRGVDVGGQADVDPDDSASPDAEDVDWDAFT